MRLSPKDARTILLKCPSDIGIRNTGRKGTLDAPGQLLQDHGYDNVYIDEVFPHEFSLPDNQQRIRDRIDELLQHQPPVISLGGDHSVSYPLISAFRDAHPGLKLVWIDAHYDLKEVRLDEGVPHDAVIRALLDDGLDLEDILFAGVRESDPDEDDFLLQRQTNELSVDEIEGNSQGALQDLVDERLTPGSDPVYVSVDIDVLDADRVPGTTFPSQDGVSLEAAEKLVRSFKDYNIVGWDLVEIAPSLDQGGKTLEAGRTLLDTMLD
ncbi:MAG: arginase family protein [Candidatus Nanohaloarchaea archaeon]|nr:arginase family protein [Candidatus Nanohaloarchaea archaeon]